MSEPRQKRARGPRNVTALRKRGVVTAATATRMTGRPIAELLADGRFPRPLAHRSLGGALLFDADELATYLETARPYVTASELCEAAGCPTRLSRAMLLADPALPVGGIVDGERAWPREEARRFIAERCGENVATAAFGARPCAS
jgi:hypothetical protein